MRCFVTTHSEGRHQAFMNGEQLGPEPTEIDLVRRMRKKWGVDLQRCRYSSTGDGFKVVILWTEET